MSKAKHITLFTMGHIDHASSRIRGVQYIPYLEKAGYRVQWIPRVPPKPQSGLEKWLLFPLRKRYLTLKRTFALLFTRPDVFFIQKIFIPSWLIKVLEIRTIPFIFDFDDAIYLDAKNSKAKSQTLAIIQKASKVIVSSPVLKEFCLEHGVEPMMITTPVNVHRICPLDKEKNNESFVIGWIGSFWTTKYLEIVKEPLQLLAKKYDFVLRLVGADKSFQIAGVNIEHLDWCEEKEKEYLQHFDVGIMPLFDAPYSRAKGGYKLLMYMSAGLPAIASPVGINRIIIRPNKTGFLASDTLQWLQAFEYFINKPSEARRFGRAARSKAVEEYSREVCFKKLLSVLSSVLV